MKEYIVGVTMLECFTVTAESEEEAEDIVRDMDDDKLLDNSDFNINYVDEVPQ